MNKFDRPKSYKPIIPISKTIIRPKVMPSKDEDVFRFRFLERPMRWYRSWDFNK